MSTVKVVGNTTVEGLVIYVNPDNREEMRKVDALLCVITELNFALKKWPQFSSAHEGFAVLLEEVDELKAHVWTRQDRRDLNAMRYEAVQISAMALRFALEVCDEESGRK